MEQLDLHLPFTFCFLYVSCIFFFLSLFFRHCMFSSVQFCTIVQTCLNLCDPMHHSMPGLPVHHFQSPPQPMSIELVMPFNHLILCCPLLLLPSIFPSIRVFSSQSALRIMWPKYWSFSLNISPSNEHP